MTLPIFRNAGSQLVRALSGGNQVTITHVDTGEVIERPGFYKSKMAMKDPYGDRTEYQDVPRFRVADLPAEWSEESMQGDQLVDSKGDRWVVDAAQMSAAGSATLFVRKVGRA